MAARMAMVVRTRISAMPRCWTGAERISEVQRRGERNAGLRRPGPLLSLLVEHGDGDAHARRQHRATGARGRIRLPLVAPFPGGCVPGLDGEAEHVLGQDGPLTAAVGSSSICDFTRRKSDLFPLESRL